MTDRPTSLGRPLAVPSGRLSRLARFGGVAGAIAGSAAWSGARAWGRGERPDLRALLLTPGNVTRFADELARMRGAAMKLGQLISMDAGEMLPPELAEIMARLRADADHMPPKQLRAVLEAEWGRGWLSRFRSFEVRPLAAASIGQVHRARTRDGRDLAVKVQYPGVRASIDSDVDNVAALLRWSGLVPEGVDISPMLAEAKRQLHEEADYAREGDRLRRFGALLADAPDFRLPELAGDLTTPSVLAMTHVPGVPVESLVDAPQAERDRVVRLLLELLFRELFEFRLMQTDPNFANYRYDRETGRIVLLDFGASREFSVEAAEGYRELMRAGLAGEREAIRRAAIGVGLFAEETAPRHQDMVLDLMEIAGVPLRAPGVFDFGASNIAERMRAGGMALSAEREFVHVPPMDTFYLQRKFAGLYLLATRLRARVDIGALTAPHL